ncbi:3'-5' exonuclease [Nocardia niigatensis]
MDHNLRLAAQHDAALWARQVLRDPAVTVLDTETTGLTGAFIVEITVLSVDRRPLLHTLVNPGVPIPESATRIHGITDRDVAAAPTFDAVLPQLQQVLRGKRVVAYHSDFDAEIIDNELDRLGIQPRAGLGELEPGTGPWWVERGTRVECAMRRYSAWRGVWDEARNDFRRHRLEGGHRSHDDCLALVDRLEEMAGEPAPRPRVWEAEGSCLDAAQAAAPTTRSVPPAGSALDAEVAVPPPIRLGAFPDITVDA